LAGRQPEVPLAAGVFAEDGDESLKGSEDGSVDYDRTGEAMLDVL
jgi:hypothetical protein